MNVDLSHAFGGMTSKESDTHNKDTVTYFPYAAHGYVVGYELYVCSWLHTGNKQSVFHLLCSLE